MAIPSLDENLLESRWRAELNLAFVRVDRHTVLKRQKHCGPLLVQKPFYPETDGTCHVYILHPPGGLVGGDDLNIDIDIGPGAGHDGGRVVFTGTPAELIADGATLTARHLGDYVRQSVQV